MFCSSGFLRLFSKYDEFVFLHIIMNCDIVNLFEDVLYKSIHLTFDMLFKIYSICKMLRF